MTKVTTHSQHLEQQSESRFLSLWLLPCIADTNRLQRQINALSEHYDSPGFIPHVTLTSPVRIECTRAAFLASRLVQSSDSLTLSADKYYCQAHYFRFLALRLPLTSELQHLYLQCRQLFSPQPADFVPHLSLMYAKPDPQLAQSIIATLDQTLLGTPLTLDRLAIVDVEGQPCGWSVTNTWKLGINPDD